MCAVDIYLLKVDIYTYIFKRLKKKNVIMAGSTI